MVRSYGFTDWRNYQQQYIALLNQDSLNSVSHNYLKVGIREVNLPHLKGVDRCKTCHLGIENSDMVDADQPHRVHPGDLLKHHPVDEFGCVVCHGGQGQALDTLNAFARSSDIEWPEPMHADTYVEGQCGKCHLALFSDNMVLTNTDQFQRGKEVFQREGCLGCHKARGVGGSIGPDLTRQGDKALIEYEFANIKGEKTINNWLMEHFKDPEVISPGSQMLAYNLPKDDVEALVTFLLGLSHPNYPFEYISTKVLNELKGERELLKGHQTFDLICTSCHGNDGRGKDYLKYEKGSPGILNSNFASVASNDYLDFIIHHGRSALSSMPSFRERFSGLKTEEIDSLVRFIQDHHNTNANIQSVLAIHGNVNKGKEIYQQHCSYCHGKDARGGIGLGLNRSYFFKTASPEFVAKTILHGRKNSGMPGWAGLGNEQLADVLSYIQSLSGNQIKKHHIQLALGDKQAGHDQFHYRCSRCHGDNGEGGTGPAILNRQFLDAADNYFLYETIKLGRTGTPMHGWANELNSSGGMSEQELLDVWTFMKSHKDLEPEYIYSGANKGEAKKGAVTFRKHCSKCHDDSGEGKEAPSLNSQEFLNGASNGFLLSTMVLGRKPTAMPQWAVSDSAHQQLTPQQMHNVVAYIRSWQTTMIGRKSE